MVDISDFQVDSGKSHTHIALVGDELCFLNIDNADNIINSIKCSIDNECDMYEQIGDICIPHIPFNGQPDMGANFLYMIMRRLYNAHSPVVALTNPNVDQDHPPLGGMPSAKSVLCAPFARVNGEMLSEIVATFAGVCRHMEVEFDPNPVANMHYLPLTWPITAYKEGNELHVDAAFHEEPSLVLSVRLNDQPVLGKIKMSAKKAKDAAIIDSILMYSRKSIKGDESKARDLVPLISKDRSRDMSYFLAMGRCLHRIFKGEGEGLELWRSACIPEMEDTCDEYWATLDTTCTYYTILTLQHWAQQDNPDKYSEWNSTSVRAALEASVMASGSVSDEADVAYRLNPTLFVCDGDDPKEAIFFKFNGTYYKRCGIFQLQDYLEDIVVPEYETYLKDLSKQCDDNPDNNFKEMMQKKIDKCIKIIVSMKIPAHQKSIIEVLMRKYNKPGFDNVRDANPHLTAFEDCVFDAERLVLRDGMPEDNMTTSTGYEFRDYYDEVTAHEGGGWEHPDVQVVIENLAKIITDPAKREFLRREFCSRLHASNPLKRGIMVQGPTNNGKSALYEWMSKAFGPIYWPDVPNNLLYSDDGHPGNASPQFEMMRFARGLPQMEVSDAMTLNEALFKRVTGATDKITYRGLYQNRIKAFTPRCVPHTVCNTFPKFNGNSAALRTRMLILKLLAKFITEKDPEWEQIAHLTEEERDDFMRENNWHYADGQFNEVINSTYKAFMWIMIQDYIRFKREIDREGNDANIGTSASHAVVRRTKTVAQVKIPKCILEDTVQYFVRANVYLQFLHAATRIDQNAHGTTTYAMYTSYKKWYSDNISRFGYASFNKFTEELESMGVKHHNDTYYNRTITYQ